MDVTQQLRKFTWRIENFSSIKETKLYSEIFYVGCEKWRLVIFPKGNKVDHLSIYVDVADSESLACVWSRYAQFRFSVINQIDRDTSITKDTQHQFNARKSDCGFTSFMPLGELYDPSRGFLVNDTCIVEADVAVCKVADYWSHDSKKETGYVGLKNQRATSYMSTLLLTLYHIPYFRKAVYHMPTTENGMPSESIPLALQTLFYKLQYSDSSVATKELTKSFGLGIYDSFGWHGLQELNRVLCEKLEDKMKGTVVEGTTQQLFEGHYMSYIKCINLDYKSTRKESFYDLQLDVKGCKDVYASFDKYVEVEHLEGNSRYHAEQYGLQDARKGVFFIDFPPVLQLRLKRFEYDFMQDKTVKINNRYEFPLQLDLDRENGKYLSPEADKSVRNLYTLHSVLVHSGGVNGGHYYAYIRPTLSDQWFKFDDERVTKEDVTKALEEQYGGEEELPQTNPGFNIPFKFTRYSNAYMLVYIRERDRDKIICNVDEKDIPEHFRIGLKKEQEEKEQKRKEKEEAHLYAVIKVACDADLAEQIGRDIYFDLVNHDKVHSFRIQKQMPFNVFKEVVAKEFGIPLQYQRFWLWAKRMNRTYRPHQPLTSEEEAQLVGQVREVSNNANKAKNAELKLFLEVELGQDLQPVPLPKMTEKDILLFFKLYDPFKEELRYVGRMFVKGAGKPVEILAKINKMAGFGLDEEIELYEEIKFEPNVMCERIDKMLTFRMSQLENGDIICFQKSVEVGSEQCRYPDVPSFLGYVHNCRQVVRFRSLEQPKEDDFSLELSKLHNYNDVVQRVADHLGVEDPSKIRLTSHNCYSQQPKSEPIEYRGVEKLSDMLTSDILYYEVSDITLPELQGLKISKVASRHAIKDGVSVDSKLITKPKEIMTPSPAILGTATILSNSRVQDTAESTYRLLPIAHTSSRKETAEPEDGTQEDIDKFFTSLESELESCNIDSSEEAAEEALATMEEALNMAPANFYDSGKFYPLKKAFKILSSFGCSSTALTIEQKTELLAMEENFKELPKRVAKAMHDRNLLTEKESVKLTLTRNLERNLIKFKEATAEVTRLEQKITALHEQVDGAEKNKEKLLAERKEIFRSSKGLKMKLEALGKELAEYEAKAKVAEVEEKIVKAEWGRMKAFISSIKGKIKIEGTASSTTGSTRAAVTSSGCSSLTGFSSTIPTSGSGFLSSTFPTVTSTANGIFGTTSATTGTGSIFGSTPSSNNNNDQMENVIAEDRVQASPTLPTFSQRPISPSASGLLFGASNSPSGATSFQFRGQPSIAAPQNQSPFLASGSVEFGAGGSFSRGTGGGHKSGRKFVMVRKQRKK